jgi:hypothetical protein
LPPAQLFFPVPFGTGSRQIPAQRFDGEPELTDELPQVLEDFGLTYFVESVGPDDF